MKPIPEQLESYISEAVDAAQQAGDLPTFSLPGGKVPIQSSKTPEQGDYATPIALASAKAAKMKPLDIANAIYKHLPVSELIAQAEVAPPGFLNLWLSDEWLRQQINIICEGGLDVFRQDFGQGQRAQVEFVSANPTGPLHIGRTRGAILGDSWAKLLEACGWSVQREYYFNNAGRQMENLGKSLKARYLEVLGADYTDYIPDFQLEGDGYQGDYLITIAQGLHAEHGDTWKEKEWHAFKEVAEAEIFKLIKATLERVGIVHDVFFNEQSVYDDNSVWETLDALKEGGHVYVSLLRENPTEEERQKAEQENWSQPATWFRTTAFGDDQDRVLVKANGDPTYVLPDIAYHVNKFERGFDQLYNVLGVDHVVEARTVQYGLQALGYDSDKIDVLFHQFVTFGDEKMSTRAGNYVTLDDLIDAVGADAVRYFMLERSANTHFDFDFDLATKNSRENPVFYIQNAHVRCCGIFRQLEEQGLPDDWDSDADLSLLGEAEMAFIRKVLELPEQMRMAYDNQSPHQIAHWTHELAGMFHPIYDEVRVLHSEVPQELAKARLRFYRAARLVFAFALKLMGMSTPQRM